jgi:hypothetical protein
MGVKDALPPARTTIELMVLTSRSIEQKNLIDSLHGWKSRANQVVQLRSILTLTLSLIAMSMEGRNIQLMLSSSAQPTPLVA